MSSVKLIAEFCQNHNGNFDILAQMIDAAAQSGATHGKMQTIFADEVSFRPQFENGLEVDGSILSIKRPYLDEYERLKKLEITYEQSRRFVSLCGDAGLTPMTTCFTRSQVTSLSEIFNVIKVASYDCGSFPMLRELSISFLEIIVSTGASYDDEIEYAASILANTNFSMLHCVTIYQTPLDQMHLNRMKYLRDLSPHVGFSDHSLVVRDGTIAARIALHQGAEIIERHFTILPADQTRDGPVSITPDMLVEIADFANRPTNEQEEILDQECPEWRIALGSKKRNLSEAELLNRDYYRGRFANKRVTSRDGREMIFNWEETSLKP